MIEIKNITKEQKADVNIPNEAFSLFGKLIPSYNDGKWTYEVLRFSSEAVTEMCFPDENYDYGTMNDSIFIGAYDGDTCIGLAILQPGFFKYMYLYDLKVNKAYRRKNVGSMLISKAKEIAAQKGYRGLYTQGQDNNLGACLFYLNTGFYIGGLDTNVYRHTKQEGKSDILFYCESDGTV